jgi:hypothetical protein
MTQKQKTIIAALVIVNVLVILALVVLVTRSPGTNLSPLPTPTLPARTLSPRPEGPTETPQEKSPTPSASLPEACQWKAARPQEKSPTPSASLPEACQWKAARLLAQAGLGGAVTLTHDGVLRFEIAHALAPGQTADDAAQLVWIAFDVALALSEDDKCTIFTQVEVAILAQGSQASPQISASVSAADLAAFDTGTLSEDEFVERVTYTVDNR